MTTTRLIAAGCVLVGSLPFLTSCGATDASQDTPANNSCPNIDGWMYTRSANQDTESAGNLQFLNGDIVFFSDVTLFGASGGRWIGFTCDEGLYHFDISEDAYLMWTDDGFATLMLAPVSGESEALVYEFSEAF